MVIPDLEDWILLLNMSDPLGDENGDGNYLYPLSSDFTPGEGLWDIKSLHVYESPWNVKFEIEMKELTNFWGLKMVLVIKLFKYTLIKITLQVAVRQMHLKGFMPKFTKIGHGK